jgi:hypothetical protein
MTRPAFAFAEDSRPPERPPSLFDDVSFGGYRVAPPPVREHLAPEPWPIECDPLLIDMRDHPPTARDVSLAISLAVVWEGEA